MTLTFSARAEDRPLLLASLVGGAVLALSAALWWRARRRSPRPVPAEPPLVDQIARLDAAYQGRQAEVSEAEWQQYESQRAELKRRLVTHLAGGRPSA